MNANTDLGFNRHTVQQENARLIKSGYTEVEQSVIEGQWQDSFTFPQTE